MSRAFEGVHGAAGAPGDDLFEIFAYGGAPVVVDEKIFIVSQFVPLSHQASQEFVFFVGVNFCSKGVGLEYICLECQIAGDEVIFVYVFEVVDFFVPY